MRLSVGLGRRCDRLSVACPFARCRPSGRSVLHTIVVVSDIGERPPVCRDRTRRRACGEETWPHLDRLRCRLCPPRAVWLVGSWRRLRLFGTDTTRRSAGHVRNAVLVGHPDERGSSALSSEVRVSAGTRLPCLARQGIRSRTTRPSGRPLPPSMSSRGADQKPMDSITAT